MGTHERKTIRMVFCARQRNTPTSDGVALLAIAPHLPAVEIRVAIGALPAHIAEHKLGVTLPAFHAGVHPSQRIGSVRMLEVGKRPDWFVARGGMAVRAWSPNRPVRAGLHAGLYSILRGRDSARLVHRVTIGAGAIINAIAQRGMLPALLVSPDTVMTAETPEFRLSL
jgi:hypothetical protein